MAYNNGFNGDITSLNYILQTLDAKTYLIPGITTNASLNITSMGESAFFYTRSVSSVVAGNVGDKVTYAVKGNVRFDIPLTSALTIGAILPQVNVATVSADVVNDKLVQESIEKANQYNKAALVAMEAGADVKEYANGATAYDALVDAIALFKTDNKKSALKPTGVMVNSAFMGKLLKDERFRNASIISDLAFSEGEVRKVSGVAVVETVDMVAEFLVINAEGFAAPINVNSLNVVDATVAGYPGGTLIAGEMGFGFKVVTKADDATLDQATGYLLAKYTEASA